MSFLLADASPTSFDVYLHGVILLVLGNLLFSATRSDDWRYILGHAFRGMIYIVTFLGGVFLFLYVGLQLLVPWLSG